MIIDLLTKSFIEFIFFIIMVSLAFVLFIKFKKITDLINHKGIKIFEVSFFYFIFYFIFRYTSYLILNFPSYLTIIKKSMIPYIITSIDFLKITSLCLALFYLLYSQVKKYNENIMKSHIYIMAIIISVLDLIFKNNTAYIIILPILLYTIMISHANYKEHKKNNYTQIFFIAILCFTLGIILEIVSSLITPFYSNFYIYNYIIYIIAFSLIAYNQYKILKW